MSLLPRHRRALRCESLERRNLLAAGLGLEHNFISPEDVDGSGDVTPYDALQIVNNLNRQNRDTAQGEDSGSHSSGLMLDVDADGYHSPSDAWRVINYLNQNGVNGALAASLVPVQERIAALESALHSSSIPSWLGDGTAQSMLASLYSGVVPELNSDLRDDLHDALQRFDLQSQYNRLNDRLGSIADDLPSFDSIFSNLGSQLSSQYNELQNELYDALDDIHDQAGSVLDHLFAHSYSDNDNDNGSTANGTTDNGSTDDHSQSPTEELSDVLSHINVELENLFDDLASDVHDLNFSGVLQTFENLISVHLPLLSSELPDLFDPDIVDLPSDFSSELSGLYNQLGSVFDRVVPEVEDAVDHVFGSLNSLGSAASQLSSFVHYLHGYGNNNDNMVQ